MDAVDAYTQVMLLKFIDFLLTEVHWYVVFINFYPVCTLYTMSCVLHRGPIKKQDTKLLSITSANNDRFSKFFHCYTQQEICNKAVIADPATP